MISDRQIKWLCRIFPISAVIGPIGIPINIGVYAIILAILI